MARREHIGSFASPAQDVKPKLTGGQALDNQCRLQSAGLE